MTGKTDDPDYWTRNVRARLAQANDYDEDEFEISAPDEDAPSNVVVEISRTDDADEWEEDEWIRFLSGTLQRGGFEAVTNSERPVTGVHILPRAPLEYPYADTDRED